MFNGMPDPSNFRYRHVNVFSFTADGALGGTAQKVGGPLDKGGMIGKNFNADGKIGGMIQENLANNKKS